MRFDGSFSMLGGIRHPRWLYIKGVLLLGPGRAGVGRADYFAFHVVQHYIDPRYRFAGLISFMRHAWSRRRC
jgi:hypothetical protein